MATRTRSMRSLHAPPRLRRPPEPASPVLRDALAPRDARARDTGGTRGGLGRSAPPPDPAPPEAAPAVARKQLDVPTVPRRHARPPANPGEAVRSAWPIGLCVLLALLLLAAGQLFDDDGSSPSTRASAPETSGIADTRTGADPTIGVDPTTAVGSGTSGLAGISLPPPTGSIPRTRPLVTVLLPAGGLGPLNRAAVEEEVEVWRDYVEQYGMADDRIAVVTGSTPPLARTADDPALPGELAAAASASPTDPLAVRYLAAAQVAAQYPEHDHQFVGIGTDIAPYVDLLPDAPVKAPTTPGAEDPPADSGAAIGLGTDPATAAPQAAQPAIVATRAGERGAIATGLARLWVAAVGAGWTGN